MQKRYGPAAGVCDCALCMIVYDTPIFLYPGTWAYEEPFKNILRKLYGDESGSTSTTRLRPSRHRVPRLRRETVSSALVNNVRGRNSTLRICIIRCPTIAAAATGPNRPHY
uniref:Uncharacterized protein n=2 Tax=gambiae species complex TaxID=44542 RepID=A0A453YZ88_ANOGA